jgi:hypothetical protein
MQGPIRKVVDSNALQSNLLRAYLFKSTNNFAVLTDYASMEAHKGNTLVSIFQSMALLAEFPKQVIVLKTTGVVCGLSGRRAGLQRRLIDEDQTRGFSKYCHGLRAAKFGNESARRQLIDNGHAADEQMDRMLADAVRMPEAVHAVSARFTETELKIIRTRSPFSDQLIRKVLESVLALAKELYARHPKATVVPSVDELPNAFLFRSALCALVWALDRIAMGGLPRDAKAENIRNDLVDQNFAAFATYFDGLLSLDQRLLRNYDRAAFVLDAITCGPGSG